jgi:hypothetical protein
MGLLASGAVAACGLVVVQRVANPGELNHGFLDPYSLVHGLVGAVLAVFGLGLAGAIAVAVGWEVVEHVLKNVAPSAFPHPTQDTLANSAGDVLSTAIGWVIAAALRARGLAPRGTPPRSRQPSRESAANPVSFSRWRLRLRGARRRP